MGDPPLLEAASQLSTLPSENNIHPDFEHMYILGINAYHGDASAVLVKDGQLVGALEEERYRRVKHWAGFPTLAIKELLALEGIEGGAIAHVAISRNPRAHLLRKASFAVRHARWNLARDRLRNAAKVGNVREPLTDALGIKAAHTPQVHFVEHHASHMASSFFVSPFADAACCTIDGFGDFVSTSMGVGRGNEIEIFRRVFFPHSLGVLYTAVTQYLGFMGYGDEFKVMGLAPYGKPSFLPQLRKLLRLRERGSFQLDLKYFNHWSQGMTMEWEGGYPSLSEIFSPALEDLLGPRRSPDVPVTSREEDIANSLQAVYEEALMHVLNSLWQRTRNPRLCLAGGCAMNSVANGKIRNQTPFTDLYIQPASSDNGTALGAAFQVWNSLLGKPRTFVMNHGYWGTSHSSDGIAGVVQARPDSDRFEISQLADHGDAARTAARLIADGNVVGWYQGRMEWGARALGNRSIIADPRRADMRELINTKIKFREKFRPFAPSIAEESLAEYFCGAVRDPFMLQVYPIQESRRETIPAVTHVDGSGRLQTVSAETNPLYYSLIKEFEKITGVPVILNTSFNENEPIVDTPRQALDCFLRTRMDAIVVNTTLIRRLPVT